MRKLLSFPDTVNETSARLVATGVVAMAVAYVVTGNGWLLVPLAYGFLARVASGPRFSPLARLVTEVITPRLHGLQRQASGSPKRFAQGMGVAFSLSAAVLHVVGQVGGARLVITMLAGAASLEAFAAICVGCKIFGALARRGWLGEDACADCADITGRSATSAHVAGRSRLT